jgi:shikimate dehydrogenase
MSKITAKTKMCIIIGDPVEHSLSPKMHNAAYESIGIADQFVFTAAKVKIEDIGKVAEAVRTMGIRGLTCTVPHKMEILKYLDEIDPIARKIGAVNTVVNNDGKLTGYNTDWMGTAIPLMRAMKEDLNIKNFETNFLQNKKVALIGAGGAARAMAYAVIEKGGDLKIFNRTIENAKKLADELGAKYESLEAMAEIESFDIIINSTTLGMGDLQDQTPVPDKYIRKCQIVFDAVYSPLKTRLLSEAAAKGVSVINGLEMLLYQGIAQFELYTGHTAPEAVMRQSIYDHFGIKL